MLIQAGTPVRDALPPLYHCARVPRIEQGLWGLAEEVPKITSDLELIISPLYACPAGRSLKFLTEDEYVNTGKYIFMYNQREEDFKPAVVSNETPQVNHSFEVVECASNPVELSYQHEDSSESDRDDDVAVRKVGKLANMLGLGSPGEIMDLKDYMERSRTLVKNEVKLSQAQDSLAGKNIKKLTERLGTTASELPALVVKAQNRSDSASTDMEEKTEKIEKIEKTEKATKLSPDLVKLISVFRTQYADIRVK
jgi:hypothetical protein